MKLSSIEWLEMEIVKLEAKFAIPHAIYELCEKAKEMHKQEIIDAFRSGLKSPYHQDYHWSPQKEGTKSEQYYDNTFKNTQQ